MLALTPVCLKVIENTVDVQSTVFSISLRQTGVREIDPGCSFKAGLQAPFLNAEAGPAYILRPFIL